LHQPLASFCRERRFLQQAVAFYSEIQSIWA
jgi:hypothetical protein